MTHIYHIPDSCDDHPGWNGAAVTKRARCIRANNADEYTVCGTNTWIVAEPDAGAALIVDPGPAESAHLDAIMAACAEMGAQPAAIALTHKHDDHSESVPAFIRIAGRMPVFARAPLADQPFAGPIDFPYRPLPDGPFAPFPSCPSLEVVSLPGHSSDSVGIIVNRDDAVLTGDTIFRDWSTVIVHPDGKLSAYLDSLELLKRLNRQGRADLLLPGHGRPIQDPDSSLESYIVHRKHRLDAMRQAIAKLGTTNAKSLSVELYKGLSPSLSEAALLATEAQLAYLEETHDPCLDI